MLKLFAKFIQNVLHLVATGYIAQMSHRAKFNTISNPDLNVRYLHTKMLKCLWLN